MLLRRLLQLIIILLLLFLLAIVAQPLFTVLEIPLRLGAGWAFHLQHTLPEVGWSVDMIVSSVIAVLLASFSLNFVARKLCAHEAPTPPAWTWRATTGVTLIVAVLFGSAMCGAGIVHQLGWLMRTEWITDGVSGRLFGPDTGRARQLVMLARSLANQGPGRLPDRLEDLRDYEEEAGALEPLFIPKTKPGEVYEPWIYLGSNLPTNAPGWLPVLVQPRPMKILRQNARVVLSLDGECKAMKEEEYQALLSKWRGYVQVEKNKQP